MNDLRLRQIILYILMTIVIAPARGQTAAGSNIVSRTVLSSDTARVLEQRVYDNGLGDVIQEVQSWPGSTLPSLAVHHKYDEYRRKTHTRLPVTSSGSGFVSGSTIASQAQSQYGDTVLTEGLSPCECDSNHHITFSIFRFFTSSVMMQGRTSGATNWMVMSRNCKPSTWRAKSP